MAGFDIQVSTVPRAWLTALNQVYELEQRLAKQGDSCNLQRNVEKLKDAFEEMGLVYEDPMGQRVTETRTDLEVSIAGSGTENLVVVEVIKPIIRFVDRRMPGFSKVVQRGIAVVTATEEVK
ncbi:MAG: hypothetical protein C4547_00330 [Phycisphaerales bacterium]|nr:MAG: hypothetical protein C4547_00330 [Phycisphaerales bacterium]